MKEMQFTTDELQTLVWALNSQLSQVRIRNVESGRPMMNETATRLSDMCGRAYMFLQMLFMGNVKAPLGDG